MGPLTQRFSRSSNVRVALAPQTTAGDKRAFDMRPKVTKDLRYEPRVYFAEEAQPALLDDLKP